MRSYRAYADANGILSINSTCKGIVLIPDVPEYEQAQPNPETGDKGSAPGVYPLELVLSGNGEALRIADGGEKSLAASTFVVQAEGVPGRSAWNVVLLDAFEHYTHTPGVRHTMTVPLMTQNHLFVGTPRQIEDGVVDWEGLGPSQAGFDIHPYTESLRFNFFLDAVTPVDTITEVKARVWVKPQSAPDNDFTLWAELPISRNCTYERKDLPHGAHALITLDAEPDTGVAIVPSVDATLRFP